MKIAFNLILILKNVYCSIWYIKFNFFIVILKKKVLAHFMPVLHPKTDVIYIKSSSNLSIIYFSLIIMEFESRVSRVVEACFKHFTIL